MKEKSRVEKMMTEFEKSPPVTPFRWMRFVRNKTQLQLEKETGINQGRISSFERNTRTPKPWERRALAEALDINVENLLFPSDVPDENDT
jgi:transcriptional regulator with XRE-family HTH domain